VASAGHRRAGLIGLLAADAVSDMGSKMTFIALPWLVLVATGSPTAMGVVAAAELLPFIVAGAVGAPLVDRYGPRRLLIATDLASTAVVAAIVAGARGGLTVLVPLVALLGGLRGIGQNAKAVVLRPVGEAAGADMLRVTSVYYGISRFNDLVFAPLGGVLIAVFGVTTTIAIDAASFAVSAAIVAVVVRGAHVDRPAPDARPEGSYLAALWDGVRYLWGRRLLMGLFAVSFVTNLGHQANIAVFVPLWVHDVLHSAAGLGVLGGAYALGALIGSAVYTAVAPKVSRYWVFTLGFIAAGAPRYLALAFSDDLTVAAVAFFVSGFAVSPVLTIIGALLYDRVPVDLQARVFGAATAIALAGTPIGVVLGGWAAATFGLTAAALLIGVSYVAATLSPLIWRGTWQDMDRQPVT